MKVGLNKRQYKLISELVKQEIDEQGDINSEPSAGTSQTQSGGQGYPQVGKWESGVTRGPANQIGVSKWSDVVGATLKRGKANQLKEENLSEQQNSQSYVGKERPSEIIPMKDLDPRLCNVILKPGEQNPCYVKKKIPGTNIDSNEYLYVGYNSPIRGVITGTIEQIKPQHNKEVDNWLKANLNITLADENRFYNRKSKKGRDVPKGFNPDKYDEYYEKKSVLDKKFMTMRNELVNISDPQKRNEINNQLKLIRNNITNLNKQYYSTEFSYGALPPQEKELYDQRIKEIKEEYEKKLKIYNQKCGVLSNKSYNREKIDNTTYVNPYGKEKIGFTQKDPCEEEFYLINSEYNMETKRVNFMFGKDDWKESVGFFGENFDKFWDNWGSLISFAGNVAVIAFSGGIAVGFSRAIQGASKLIGVAVEVSGGVRAIAPYAADAAFNALIGSYELSRGNKRNALVSMMCAIVPFISYGKNVGKISIKEAEDMINKINKVDLSNAVRIQTLVNSLNDRQRYIFRNVMSLPKEAIKRNYDEVLKIAKEGAKKAGIEIPKSTFKHWGPPIGKVLSIEGGIPLSTMLADVFFDFFKERSKLKLTPEQQSYFKNNIKMVLSEMSLPQIIHVVKDIEKEPIEAVNPKDFLNEFKSRKFKFEKLSEEEIKFALSINGLPPDYFEKQKDNKIDTNKYIQPLIQKLDSVKLEN